MQDGKTFGWNVNGKQALGLCAFLVVGYRIVHCEALVFGYGLAGRALSAFFMIVAFDIGVARQPKPEALPIEAPEADLAAAEWIERADREAAAVRVG
jgi:hypothetical protein